MLKPMISYAQNFEDVMLRRALLGVETGFYVDVGAWDPNEHSVTRHFYDQGWRGINVEPIESYRSSFELARPRDINLFVAAGKASGRAIITQIEGTGLSTFALTSPVRQLADESYHRREIEVEVRTLDSIFDEYAPPQVHFLKIDCEGSEADVINHFDLSRHRPWILLVEATAPMTSEPNHHAWEDHVLAAGYRFVYFDGINRFYTASEHAELEEAFKVPPNVFDNFASIAFAAELQPAPQPVESVRPWFRQGV